MTARLALHTLIVIAGVVTRYDLADHAGNVTRCGNVYDADYRGLAVDIDALGWQCGDTVLIQSNGWHWFTVQDSGPLSRYCVQSDTGCVPIVADVPEAAWWAGDDISTPAVVINVSLLRERLEMER